MATKSITKNIDIKSKHECRNFINALENAQHKGKKNVVISKPCSDLSNEKIKELFGDY